MENEIQTIEEKPEAVVPARKTQPPHVEVNDF
jgi:hypothetical protein